MIGIVDLVSIGVKTLRLIVGVLWRKSSLNDLYKSLNDIIHNNKLG